ncbi:hypothetical protein Mesil_0524 [Allomeiothermus silvanus DSM 9946]|uniref:Uncharacterized protein n=1 Tax=Allomeiothermus silvanus (strain ATCC 700542 / DSM 9946 / NBRC 106475 / NCIMB 13440 / VI-R2) TaxID=526227 RepID=D7BA23_ALLS1|nr:hypothetical protein [Allomeiothermus silvanus]ADH62457.1 hypothetical protein Mesil_0524 [Allomeiothermus silvanus DSM 9946]
MTLEHVALVWQQGVGFGFKAGVGVGLVGGLAIAWLWRWWTQRRPH